MTAVVISPPVFVLALRRVVGFCPLLKSRHAIIIGVNGMFGKNTIVVVWGDRGFELSAVI